MHGRNYDKKEKIQKVIEKGFGLDIVDWEHARARVSDAKRDYIFEIVMKGIELSQVTLVLFTDDEEVEMRSKFLDKSDKLEISFKDRRKRRRQARPNVYIEAGYALGVRPNRTIFLEWPDDLSVFSSPSDFQGIHVIKYNDTPESRKILKNRLECARCLLNLDPGWDKI